MEAYKEMSPFMLAQIEGEEVRSMENMETLGAKDRVLEYAGSIITHGYLVRDYYRDTAGEWWYENRAVLDGRIVSMETYLFGRDMTKGKGVRSHT